MDSEGFKPIGRRRDFAFHDSPIIFSEKNEQDYKPHLAHRHSSKYTEYFRHRREMPFSHDEINKVARSANLSIISFRLSNIEERKLIRRIIGITMKCRCSGLVGMKFSTAISHSCTSNITNVLLLCQSLEQAARIGDAIEGIAKVAPHPAVVPLMLCTFHLNLLNRRVDTTWENLFDIEAASGQSGILDPDDGFIVVGKCDDPKLSKKAIGATQLAIAWETYAQSDVEFIAYINEFVNSYHSEPGTIQEEQR
jgi:hypothetical protein